MGALTLARLVALESLRRPRAVLASIMLALSAGFVILPDPGASYATLTFHRHPLIYTPAVMGFITGGEFVAFAIVLGMLTISALVPLRAWRVALGVSGASSRSLSLGMWTVTFGVGLFLLTCIFGGALLRAWNVICAGGNCLGGLWIYFTWTFGLGIAGAGLAATAASVLALRLATRPALMAGATFVVWIAVLGALIAGQTDIAGHAFALAHLLPQGDRQALQMGIIGGARQATGVKSRDVGDLLSVSGGVQFLLVRAALVLATLLAALILSGPRLKPLATRSKASEHVIGAYFSAFSASFGLTGVVVGQLWSAPLWTFALLVAAVAVETVYAGMPLSVVALGFAWGLYMLRWPGLCEAFEQGGLRSLVQPSVLGPWPIRLRIGVAIALQMGILALPLAMARAGAGRMHGLQWLGFQIAAAALLCVGLARLRGGATMFSLAAMFWWYLMVSGNAHIPAG